MGQGHTHVYAQYNMMKYLLKHDCTCSLISIVGGEILKQVLIMRQIRLIHQQIRRNHLQNALRCVNWRFFLNRQGRLALNTEEEFAHWDSPEISRESYLCFIVSTRSTTRKPGILFLKRTIEIMVQRTRRRTFHQSPKLQKRSNDTTLPKITKIITLYDGKSWIATETIYNLKYDRNYSLKRKLVVSTV